MSELRIPTSLADFQSDLRLIQEAHGPDISVVSINAGADHPYIMVLTPGSPFAPMVLVNIPGQRQTIEMVNAYAQLPANAKAQKPLGAVHRANLASMPSCSRPSSTVLHHPATALG
jgi:hypothetical protein